MPRKAGWLPPVLDGRERKDWPSVWFVNPFLDGPYLDTGDTWLFEVQAQWDGGGGWFTTWAVPGPGRCQRDLAITKLRVRARAWGFARVYIYREIRPQLPAERNDIAEFNLRMRHARRDATNANRRRNVVGLVG